MWLPRRFDKVDGEDPIPIPKAGQQDRGRGRVKFFTSSSSSDSSSSRSVAVAAYASRSILVSIMFLQFESKRALSHQSLLDLESRWLQRFAPAQGRLVVQGITKHFAVIQV